MELQVRAPLPPAQCLSPSPDHGLSNSRRPLHESTGNAQNARVLWFAQHLLPFNAFASIPSPLPMPSILRTQSLGGEYSALPSSKSQQRHDRHAHSRRVSQGVNPLMPLLTQAFQNYRKKQADKPDQKWPDVLEGPFLDALLLIPQMRRKKYTMKQTQYGRNMLIGEYLWIAYCQTLPPGVEPDPLMMRERKMVSSHIQVFKNFFSNHRCFHFFFGQRQDDKDKDNIETVSLKNNPVLIALSEGRLPDERPNYEYFAQILTLNEQVTVRPKRCWIFVSHQDVVVAEDGDGYVPATGEKLSESEYPHLVRNLERETWAKEEQQIFKGGLLHEFTKEIHQVESSSVREISRKWETAFPSLYQRLEAITATTTDAQCDILHMHVTLELKERRRFPSQSELNSWVEINIEQPRLLNHRWKVHTVLARPEELSYSHDDAPPELLYETSAEIAMQYQHRPGCEGAREGGGQCDCISQRCRRDYVTVPFPADVWALTLTNCAEYPAHPFSDGKRHDRGSGPIVKREDDHDGEPRSRRRNRQSTQMDLVPKIAMMQEIWSCPPSLPHERSQRWTRRALILWTFETIHSIEDGKLVTAQGGRTNWRFLTILDPASEYHQQRAIINPRRTSSSDGYGEHSSGLASGVPPSSRDIVTSPSPIYQPDMSASISENFAAWDNAGGLGTLSTSAAQAAYSAHLMAQTSASHTTTVQAGYDLLGSLNSHSGLATPPPSATLTTSFAPGFDTASNSAGIHPGYIPSHVAATTAGMDACSQGLGSSLAAVTDPFLAHVSNATYGESQDSIHSWSDHAIGSNMDSAAAWPSTYPSTSAIAGGSYSHSVAGAWTESQLQSAPARGSSEQRRSSSNAEQHQSQGQQQQQQQQHHRQQQQLSQQVWIPSDTTGNEHDIWTPATSAHTPGESAATATTTNTTQPGSSHDHHKAAGEAEWVLIHSTATSAAGCDSDLSQDWEEIAAPSSSVSSSSNSHSPFMPIETATRAVKVIAEVEEILRRHGGFPPRTATQMSRLKRRRSDSSVDGDEEQQEGETGVCRRRPRC